MFEEQNVLVCDWCDERLTYEPFNRTYKNDRYQFCTVACLNSHFAACTAIDRRAQRLEKV